MGRYATMQSMTQMAATRRRSRRGLKATLSVLAAVLVLGLVAIIAVMVRLNAAVDQIAVIEEAFPAERMPVHETDAGSPMNILLLGTDARGEGMMESLGSRADAIMVVHVAPDRKTVHVMSIMRDAWVEIPGHGEAKVNAALAYGGVPLMVETVESIIDQRIDHVAIIDFEGFKGLTRELGGVTLDNDVAFSRDEFSFDEGEITITDGNAALAYVRERYAFPTGDYQRVKNQQAFMSGLAKELLAPEVLANPLRLADLTDSVGPNVRRSDTLTGMEIAGLGTGLVFSNWGRPPIEMFTMPTNGTGWAGDQSIVLVNWEGMELVRDAFKDESMVNFEAPPVAP